MFKIAQSDSYFWPVKVEFPGDGGKLVKASFDAEFKRLNQAEIEALTQRVQSGELDDKRLIAETLVGWKGPQDEEGNELPYSETNREKLMNIYPVQPSTVAAFFDSIKRGREKN